MSHNSLRHPNGSRARQRTSAAWRALPAGVWAMGFGSLFMDISSEMIHSLLPLYMVTMLGASTVTVGIVEGIAEATAAIVKVFSGALSDYLGKRKFVMILGYGLAALAKPMFPLATSNAWVFAARFVDRIGKGIRGAPRDALVADITPEPLRGAAYGLRQALDSVGALMGPLLAMAFMIWLADDIRSVLWIAVVPAWMAVAFLVIYVREPATAKVTGPAKSPLSIGDVKRLPRRYWLVVLLGVVVSLGRFSEAFLVLRAESVGLSLGYVPVVMAAMNAFYAAAAFPAGVASDRLRPRTLLLTGLALLIVADVVLAAAEGTAAVLVGASIWGLHMAMTQGLLSKLVSDIVPARLLGTGFGLVNLACGVALLLASVIAGSLWSAIGPSATFLAGAGFAAISAIGLLSVSRFALRPTEP